MNLIFWIFFVFSFWFENRQIICKKKFNLAIKITINIADIASI